MENMIIFGAGKAGFRAKRDVEGRFCVKYFADNDKKKQGQILDGIPIISVEKAIELVEKQECKGSLLISTYINREGGRRFGVIEQIAESKITADVYALSSAYIRDTAVRDIRNKRKIEDEMRRIDVTKPSLLCYQYHVAHHCNLKCKGWGHRSNVAKPEFGDFGRYSEDVHRLSELFCTVGLIELLGGEPLLNPKLPDFIRVTRKVFPLADIRVYTNGLLIPHISQDVFDAMREYDAEFTISLYPPTRDIIETIKMRCWENDIPYNILPFIEKFGVCMFDEEGKSDPAEAYSRCTIDRNCHFLMDGRLSMCPLPPIYEKFKDTFKEKLKFEEGKDFINLYDSAIDGFVINELISKPMPACRYCNKELKHTIDWESHYDKVYYP